MTGGSFKGATAAEAEDTAGSAPPVGAADAMAAVAAFEAAKSDPTLAQAATAYFLEQIRLVDLQRIRLKQLLLKERLRTGLKICLALLVTLFGAFLAMLMIDAAGAKGMVVAGFSVPRSLAEHGITGDVLAQDLASRMTAISRFANLHSITQSEEARLDEPKSVRLAVASTGLSLDDAGRFLRKQLGQERGVTGDLREFGAVGEERIQLSVRMTGADPMVLEGALPDLDRVMQEAAERAFAEFDPATIVIYLDAKGRAAEALAAAERGAQLTSSRKVRANAYALWGAVDSDMSRSLKRAEIAIALDPSLMVGWWQGSIASARLGHSEAVLNYARHQVQSRLEDQLPALRAGYQRVLADGRKAIDLCQGDFQHLASDQSSLTETEAERLIGEAEIATHQHDRVLAAQKISLAEFAGSLNAKRLLRQRWAAAAESGDWAAARSFAQALVDAQNESPPGQKMTSDDQADLELMTVDQPQLALALAMSGDIEGAIALIAPTPLDCYLCVRIRARIAAASGDNSAADHWFAEAVRQAPSIPYAETEWGAVLLARSDMDRAISKFYAAHTVGPHFADPLKGWGDALAHQLRWKEAIAVYDEALTYAPNWAELRSALGEAVQHEDTHKESR